MSSVTSVRLCPYNFRDNTHGQHHFLLSVVQQPHLLTRHPLGLTPSPLTFKALKSFPGWIKQSPQLATPWEQTARLSLSQVPSGRSSRTPNRKSRNGQWMGGRIPRVGTLSKLRPAKGTQELALMQNGRRKSQNRGRETEKRSASRMPDLPKEGSRVFQHAVYLVHSPVPGIQ